MARSRRMRQGGSRRRTQDEDQQVESISSDASDSDQAGSSVRRRGRRSRRMSAESSNTVDEVVPDIDVEDIEVPVESQPEEPADEASDNADSSDVEEGESSPNNRRSARRSARTAAASGRSARRSARTEVEDDEGGRSARRSAKKSARGGKAGKAGKGGKAGKSGKAKKASRRKQLSPEELAEQKARRNKFLLGIVLVIAIGGGAAGLAVALHEEPQTLTVELTDDQFEQSGTKDVIAKLLLDKTYDLLVRAENNMQDKRPELVQTELENAGKLLEQALISDATPEENRASGEFLSRAFEYRKKLAEIARDLPSLQLWKQARERYDLLAQELGKLNELEDLEGFDERRQEFIINPYNREEGQTLNNDLVAFESEISLLKQADSRVRDERKRRVDAVTIDIVARANRETDALIAKMHYGAAFALLEQLSEEFPLADLGQVLNKVELSFESQWTSDKTYATSRFNYSIAPSTADSKRLAARAEAIAKVEEVISTYGSEVIRTSAVVEEAKSMLEEYRRAQ